MHCSCLFDGDSEQAGGSFRMHMRVGEGGGSGAQV